jgi:hypothetical protein
MDINGRFPKSWGYPQFSSKSFKIDHDLVLSYLWQLEDSPFEENPWRIDSDWKIQWETTREWRYPLAV